MKIDSSLVKKLREATGFGMMECKRALEKCEGSIEAATKHLRESLADKSAAKADRATDNGVVAVAVNPDNKAVAAVSLSCETDFVARGEAFQQVALDLAKALAYSECKNEEDFINYESKELGGVVSDIIKDKIGVIKENIKLKSAKALRSDSSEEIISFYIHSTDPVYKENVGKIASIVKVASSNSSISDSIRKIAMHVAALSPESVDVEGVDANKVKEEKDIFITQAKGSGKPDSIIEKMVDGRLRKFYEEIVLLEQIFAMDPEGKKKVKEWLASIDSGAKILEFFRLSV